jgi:uncharacterized protein DUF4154
MRSTGCLRDCKSPGCRAGTNGKSTRRVWLLRLGRRAARRQGAIVQCLGNRTRIAPWKARPSQTQPWPGVRARWLASIVALLLAAYFSLLNQAVYADHSRTEVQIKAAYLFNFLKFVEWPSDAPAEPQGKWVIGVVGDSPVGGELKRMAEGKSVDGRSLLVKTIRATDGLRGYNIIFVSASEEKHFPSILIALQGSCVLTVADFDNFIRHGGMIQFVAQGDRVRVDIDVGATGRARLKVSSKLLSLAQAVTETVRSARN